MRSSCQGCVFVPPTPRGNGLSPRNVAECMRVCVCTPTAGILPGAEEEEGEEVS